MFGRKNLLSDGARIDGVVVKAWFSDPGFNNRLGVEVRVRFSDGSSGECTDRMLWVDDVGLLAEGSVVPVRYDPSTHSKLAIDVPALKERHAPVKAKREAEREARLEAQLSQLGGTDAAADPPAPAQPQVSIPSAPILAPSAVGALRVGQRVTYRDVVSGETKTWTIVAGKYGDRGAGKMSEEAPVAKALLGHAPSDRVSLTTMDGPLELEILAVDELAP